jgi:hypothetical protein
MREARNRIQTVLTNAWRQAHPHLNAALVVDIWAWAEGGNYSWSVSPEMYTSWFEDVEFDQDTLRAAIGDENALTASWRFDV